MKNIDKQEKEEKMRKIILIIAITFSVIFLSNFASSITWTTPSTPSVSDSWAGNYTNYYNKSEVYNKSEIDSNNASWSSTFNQTYQDYLAANQSNNSAHLNGKVEGDLNVNYSVTSNSTSWWAGLSGWVNGFFQKTGNDLDVNNTYINNSVNVNSSNNANTLRSLSPQQVADLYVETDPIWTAVSGNYWLSNGSSTATGNWNIENYNLTTTDTINASKYCNATECKDLSEWGGSFTETEPAWNGNYTNVVFNNTNGRYNISINSNLPITTTDTATFGSLDVNSGSFVVDANGVGIGIGGSTQSALNIYKVLNAGIVKGIYNQIIVDGYTTTFAYGLDFSVSWVPLLGTTSNKAMTAMYGGYSVPMIELDAEETYNFTVTNFYTYYGSASLTGSDGDGLAKITNAYIFGTANPSVYNEEITNLVAFYSPKMTRATNNWQYYSVGGNNFMGADNSKTYFGTGTTGLAGAKDASIYYDGTNLIINPKEVGTGILDVLGVLQTDGYNSADGSAGVSGSFTSQDGKTITVKNGLITAIV